MTIRRFLRTGPATLAVASLLTLAACSGSGDTDTTPDSTGGADGIHTTDPMGHAVDLDHEPTAALGFYTTDVDILATLGFPLASSQPVRDDYDRLPDYFPAAAHDGVSYFHNYPEFNYEAVAEAAPDFVLNGLGYDDTSHDRLSAIAPTYTTNAFDGESWLPHFEQTAKDLGRQAEFDEWRQDYTDAGKDAAEAIDKAGLSDLTVAPLNYWGDKIQVGCYAGLECGVFENIGLTVDPGSRDSEVGLSMEQLDRLKDIDAVWIPTSRGETDDLNLMLDALKDNRQWAELPFLTSSPP